MRLALPGAAVLLPIAFFLSVLSPDATEPNALVNLAYLGALLLVAGMITLGVGLVRVRPTATSHGRWSPGADGRWPRAGC